MYLLLLLAIGASTASPLGFQGTPTNVVNASRCHCLSLVRLRNERANSTPTAVPTMTSSLSSVRPRNVPVAQRGCSFAVSPRTILKSNCLTHLRQWAVTFLAPQTGPHTATIISLHRSTEHVRRVPDKPRLNNALAFDFVAKLLCNTHTSVLVRPSIIRTAFSTAPFD